MHEHYRYSRKSLLAFLLLPAMGITVAATAQDSAMFRGDLEHNANSTGGPPALHSIRWKFETRGEVVSTPAIVQGVVFVGSNDGNLYALDQQTGAMKWKFEAHSRVPSSPAVADGVVYFGSYDGFFYAVDASDGKLKWKFRNAGERRFAATHLHGSQPVNETMPDPYTCHHRRYGMQRYTSAAATATSTRWMPQRVQ